jgi:hypothetical protein
MDKQTTFNNVICARCKLKHNNVKAYTMAGAIRKATLLCTGILQTREGPTKTICAASFMRDVDVDQ